jgi:hypothetical protein
MKGFLRNPLLQSIVSASILTGVPMHAAAQRLTLDLESGLVGTQYNDVRIPGDTGTLFSFAEDLRTDRAGFVRARVFVRIGERHDIGFLAAPLRLRAHGVIGRDTRFQETTFPANALLSGRYRFDSYRLTYRYRARTGGNPEIDFGLTAKIRDASIALESDGSDAEKTNTGFVPLLYFRLRWAFGRHTSLLLEGDALAAPQGRAEDVSLALEREIIGESLALRLGYRILEGGADNEEVYTFAWIDYLTFGLSLSL